MIEHPSTPAAVGAGADGAAGSHPAPAAHHAGPKHPPAQPAGAHKPEAAAEGESPAESSAAHLSLLQWLNPLRLFRKETPDRLVQQGQRQADAHNLNQALLSFHQAIALDERCAEAYRGLGKVTQMKGGKANQLAALSFLHQAAKLDPFTDSTYQATAALYEKMGKRDEAQLERKKMAVVKALQLDPNNAVANNNMGILFLQQELAAQAIEYFHKALAAKPNYEVAHRNLATTFYKLALSAKEPAEKQQHVEQAMEAVEKALALGESASTLIILARLQVMAGHEETALLSLERAESLDPAHQEIYAIKQVALEKLGRMSDAQKAYEQFQSYAKKTR